MQKSKLLLILYAAATATDLLAVTQEMDQLRYVSKSILIPILAIYAAIRFSHYKKTFVLLMVALLFSWIGDLLLLLDNGQPVFFIGGLLAFLFAHIGYIFINHQTRFTDTELALLSTQQIRYVFILVMAGSGIIYVLLPHLNQLKLPVILYAITLTYMAITALYRYGRTSGKSFALVFSGALFFMLSDSMLAISKFMGAFSHDGFWIMFTYASAQFLLVEGIVSHETN